MMTLTNGYCYRSIRLPLPPSANDLVRPALMGRRARLVSTKAAKDFRKAAHAVLDGLQRDTYGQLSPETGPVRLIAHFFVTSVASDVSNRVKALEDALSGYAWVDDKQVCEVLAVKRFTDGDEPHCNVVVERVTDEAMRERLEKGEARAAKARRKASKVAPRGYSPEEAVVAADDPARAERFIKAALKPTPASYPAVRGLGPKGCSCLTGDADEPHAPHCVRALVERQRAPHLTPATYRPGGKR